MPQPLSLLVLLLLKQTKQYSHLSESCNVDGLCCLACSHSCFFCFSVSLTKNMTSNHQTMTNASSASVCASKRTQQQWHWHQWGGATHSHQVHVTYVVLHTGKRQGQNTIILSLTPTTGFSVCCVSNLEQCNSSSKILLQLSLHFIAKA
jgi:hypothetical protein